MAKTIRKVGIGTLTSKGQVTIPSEIRKQLDLKEGEQLLFISGKDGMLVRKLDAEEAMKAFYREMEETDPDDVPLSKEEKEQLENPDGYVSFEELKRDLEV